jgi:beta-galactosidase
MEWGADNLANRHVEKPYTGFEEIIPGQGADERDGDFFLTGGEPRVSSLGDWSVTYFCDLIDWYLKSQEKMDWLTGTAQWVFKDFSTPVRPDSPIPYMNLNPDPSFFSQPIPRKSNQKIRFFQPISLAMASI